jgi:hypothetical protein
MCDIRDERSLVVCDVAVDRYRRVLSDRLGSTVSFTHVDHQPTLIECHDQSLLPEFQRLIQQLMDES